MNAKDCRAVRLEIDSSGLGQRLSGQAEAHVLSCAACAQFQAERTELRELVGSLQPVVAPADFDLRLRARIAREREHQARQPSIFRFAVTTPALALATLLVVGVGAIVWISQKNGTESPKAGVSTPAQKTDNSTQSAAVDPKPTSNEPNQATVTPVNPPDSRKPSNQLARGGGKTSTTSGAPSQVSEFNTRGAESIRQTADRAGEVSVTAPSKPMVVLVQDANGKTHKILLPPISFGSQRLDQRTPVSMTNRKDW